MNLRVSPENPLAKHRPEGRAVLTFVLAFLLGPALLLAQEASVTLAWLPNTEPDLAGYTVYYGRASGVYEHVVDAGASNRITISGLESGTRYYFVVTAYDTYGNESRPSEEVSWVAGSKVPVPEALAIFGNHPNPLVADTKIRFNVPQRGIVKVDVLDVLGRHVRSLANTALPAGTHELVWDGRDGKGFPVPSGTYVVVVREDAALAAHLLTVLRKTPQ